MQNEAASIEKANAYRQMMELWAWKDYQRFLDEMRKSALEMAINSEDLKDIQVQRGIVRACDSITAELGYVLGAR